MAKTLQELLCRNNKKWELSKLPFFIFVHVLCSTDVLS